MAQYAIRLGDEAKRPIECYATYAEVKAAGEAQLVKGPEEARYFDVVMVPEGVTCWPDDAEAADAWCVVAIGSPRWGVRRCRNKN